MKETERDTVGRGTDEQKFLLGLSLSDIADELVGRIKMDEELSFWTLKAAQLLSQRLPST